MHTARTATAVDPRRFGRRAQRFTCAAPIAASRLNDDVRLFGMTFAAGFLFVSVLLA